MKNFKVIILLLSLSLLNSCEKDELKTEHLANIESIKIKDLANSFSQHFESQETMSVAFEKNKINGFQSKTDENVMTIHVNMTENEVIYTEEDLPSIYSDKQKEFLLKYFNRVANVTNGELLAEIAFYKDLLNSESFGEEEYNQIYAILDVGEQTVTIINEMLPIKSNDSARTGGDLGAYFECIASQGRSIARGMVTGAITGGIRGAVIGGAGGTVVLPGIGTATGAVGGAVFGAASGAVIGAVGATLWSAADCFHLLGGSGSGGSMQSGCAPIGSTAVCVTAPSGGDQ